MRYPRVGRWDFGWGHQAWCCGFSCRDFSTRDCFLLRIPRNPLRGCCGFEIRFLGLAVSLVVVTVGFEGAFVT